MTVGHPQVWRMPLSVPLYVRVPTTTGKGFRSERGGTRTAEAVLEIDVSAILERLGLKAIYAKTRKSAALSGAVSLRVVGVRDQADKPCPKCGNPTPRFLDGAFHCEQHGRVEPVAVTSDHACAAGCGRSVLERGETCLTCRIAGARA